MTRTSLRNGRGFTLIELLVVVAIIGILVALLIPTIQKVKQQGRKSVALDEIKQIEAALLAYNAEYRRWPTGISVGDTGPNAESTAAGIPVRSSVLEALRGVNVTPANPRCVPFMTVATNRCNAAGDYVDPWGNVYRYMLDYNLDGNLLVRFSGGGSTNLLRHAAVWSPGLDKSDAPGKQADDVRSW